jgi:antitoxin FitA
MKQIELQGACTSSKLTALISADAGLKMAMLTVRNLPDEVHRALRVRAALHGRSTEAEVRAILTDAVKPAQRLRLGDTLAALSREVGLTNADFADLDAVRDNMPAKPIEFE